MGKRNFVYYTYVFMLDITEKYMVVYIVQYHSIRYIVYRQERKLLLYVCVRVFLPFILDIKFVGRTSRGHTGGRSHRISHPPSFCGACLYFSREKDSAIPFPRRP